MLGFISVSFTGSSISLFNHLLIRERKLLKLSVLCDSTFFLKDCHLKHWFSLNGDILEVIVVYFGTLIFISKQVEKISVKLLYDAFFRSRQITLTFLRSREN